MRQKLLCNIQAFPFLLERTLRTSGIAHMCTVAVTF